MLIDDVGISVTYRNTTMLFLKWEEIVVAKAIPTPHGGQLIFSDIPLYTGKESWKNSNKVFININSKLGSEFIKYKNNLSVPITDLEKLPQHTINKLKNN